MLIPIFTDLEGPIPIQVIILVVICEFALDGIGSSWDHPRGGIFRRGLIFLYFRFGTITSDHEIVLVNCGECVCVCACEWGEEEKERFSISNLSIIETRLSGCYRDETTLLFQTWMQWRVYIYSSLYCTHITKIDSLTILKRNLCPHIYLFRLLPLIPLRYVVWK